eukprot:g11318.t1
MELDVAAEEHSDRETRGEEAELESFWNLPARTPGAPPAGRATGWQAGRSPPRGALVRATRRARGGELAGAEPAGGTPRKRRKVAWYVDEEDEEPPPIAPGGRVSKMLACFNRALSRERPITLKRAVAAAGQIADGDPRPELLNLIEMTTLADFLNANPNIKPHGDTLVIMKWEFSPKALNPKSLRVPGTLLQTSRSRKTQAIQHYGVGFIMPSDWPMDKTKVAYYEKSLKVLSESVVLSLNYNLVEKLKLEAVRRLVDTNYKLPLRDLRALSNMLEARYAQTFSVNKDGVGITGVEVQCVSKLRDLGKEPDMVLLTNEVYRFAHTIKAENRILPKFGNQDTKLPTYDRTNQSLVMLRTTHGLDAVPSRSYQVGRRDPVDPTTTPCYVSERYPAALHGGFRLPRLNDLAPYDRSSRRGVVAGGATAGGGAPPTAGAGGATTAPEAAGAVGALAAGGGDDGDGGHVGRREDGDGGADDFDLGTLYEKAGMLSIITGLILDRPQTWEQLRAQSRYGLPRRADPEGKHPTSRVRLGVYCLPSGWLRSSAQLRGHARYLQPALRLLVPAGQNTVPRRPWGVACACAGLAATRQALRFAAYLRQKSLQQLDLTDLPLLA